MFSFIATCITHLSSMLDYSVSNDNALTVDSRVVNTLTPIPPEILANIIFRP